MIFWSEKLVKEDRMDLKRLREAFTDPRKDRIFILDKKNLEVIEVAESDDEEFQMEVAKKVQRFPERYIDIPRRDSSRSYEDMQKFIKERIENIGLRTKLFKAIAVERGAFSRFKDILSVEDPVLLKEWYEYINTRIEDELMEWLSEQGIEIKKPGKDGSNEISGK